MKMRQAITSNIARELAAHRALANDNFKAEVIGFT